MDDLSSYKVISVPTEVEASPDLDRFLCPGIRSTEVQVNSLKSHLAE